MNRRIAHHLDRVRRALTELAQDRVPIYGIAIDANRPRPVIHTGAGPYAWHCTAFGQDTKGHWQDYSAHLNGVELCRRIRPRHSGRIAE